MSKVLDKKYTVNDSAFDILKAIEKLARDKNQRILLEDENLWLETKLREIARLTRIVRQKYY